MSPVPPHLCPVLFNSFSAFPYAQQLESMSLQSLEQQGRECLRSLHSLVKPPLYNYICVSTSKTLETRRDTRLRAQGMPGQGARFCIHGLSIRVWGAAVPYAQEQRAEVGYRCGEVRPEALLPDAITLALNKLGDAIVGPMLVRLMRHLASAGVADAIFRLLHGS